MLWRLLYYGWFLFEVIILVKTRTKRGTGNVQDRGSLPLLWITIAVSLTLCGFSEFWFQTAFHVRDLAIAVIGIGLTIRIVSVLSLGKAFSANVAILDSQTVYQDGLYKFVRHPSYLGMLVIFLGIGLHGGNFETLALALIPTTAALLYRIHVEEIALQSAFGTGYLDYMSRTKRLIPFVY